MNTVKLFVHFFVAIAMLGGVAHASGGEFSAKDLARYMDAFPIKSQFDFYKTKQLGYHLTQITEFEGIRTYTYVYGEDIVMVQVNAASGKISRLRVQTGLNLSADVANKVYMAWLPTVSYRYGSPTEESYSNLYSMTYGNGNYKTARLRNKGNCEYSFGFNSVSWGSVNLILDINAITM